MHKYKTMKKLTAVDLIALVLTIIGGLNWGLVGLVDFNIIDSLFGTGSIIARIIFVLVGLSAVYLVVIFNKLAKK